MTIEDYVSFEIAKLLKEKGFDAECDYLYVDGQLVRAQGGACNWNGGETLFTDYKNECSAPTLQMAMKWLREVHGLFIGVVFQLECLSKEDKWFWKWNISDKRNKFALVEFGESDTYEKACEAAIKYCLENLI